MITNNKTIQTQNWHRQILSALCLSVFMLAGLSATQAQSGNLPILFYSQREGRLKNFGMNADGSNQTRIGEADARGFFARYSPDGQKIVFVRGDADATSPSGFRGQIFVMNADGTNTVNISNDPTHQPNAPAWSPDGRIVFIRFENDYSGGDLWIMNGDGSNQHLVYHSPGIYGAWYPSVSPDGTKIAFSDSDASGDYDLYVINTDGSNLRQLTDNTALDEGVDWSPDGTKIIFDRARAGAFVSSPAHQGTGGNGDIYIMNADGSNQTRLTKHGNQDFYPIFSPDGSKIVFSRWHGWQGPNIDVYVMNADGSNIIRLTHEPLWNVASDWR